MFLRYSIKISSWLLLTVASFNFDMYQFSNDLFILLFYKRWSGRIPQTTKVSIHNLPFFFQLTKIDTHKNNWIHSNRIYYNKLCVITYFVCVYVRTEMCTNNKFVSTLIWKCLDRLYWFFGGIYGVFTSLSTIFQLYHGDQFVCQKNMHLIMWIENAFKFCGKLIHFYKERISFLFYFEDGKCGAVSWLSLNAVEVKQTSHSLDVCRFRLFLWQFDGFLRIFHFPSSLKQPVLCIVHVHPHQWYLGLLD
jgi:hypothetical protein